MKKKHKKYSALFEVMEAYMHCKEYLGASQATSDLYMSSQDYVMDVDRVVGGFTEGMTEEDKEDVLVIHGLFPVEKYFEKR